MINEIYSYLRDGRQIFFLWIYLTSICIAEIVIVIISPYFGLFIHIVILLTLYFHYALYSKHNNISKLYLALSLVPLYRIINLAVPVFQMTPFYWNLLVGIPLWAAVCILIKTLDLSPIELGITLRQVPLQVIAGFCLGVPLGLLNYLILRPLPQVPKLDFLTFFCSTLIILVFISFLEELIFRGVLYHLATKTVCPSFAIIFTSMTYGSLHIFYLSYKYTLLILGASVILIWLVRHFNSLLGAVLAHGIAIISVYLIWPFYFRDLALHIEVIIREVKEIKMVCINPLLKNMNIGTLHHWNEIAPIVIIFLVIFTSVV